MLLKDEGRRRPSVGQIFITREALGVRVVLMLDDVVGADVDGVHDAAPLGGGAVLGRAGGRGARPVGGGRPTSGALDGRREA